MVLGYLYGNPTFKVSTKEICEKTGSPFDATARVMQIMTQHGLLKSEQGVKGGYTLVEDLQKISLLQLMEMILGPVEVAKCIGDTTGCELFGRCNIQNPVHKINIRLKSFYADLAISEVLTVPTTFKQVEYDRV